MCRIKSYHNHLSTKFFNWKILKTLYVKIWCRLVNWRIFVLLQWYRDQRLLFHVTTQEELQCLKNKGKQFCFVFTHRTKTSNSYHFVLAKEYHFSHICLVAQFSDLFFPYQSEDRMIKVTSFVKWNETEPTMFSWII
jgi:hypothetical protein